MAKPSDIETRKSVAIGRRRIPRRSPANAEASTKCRHPRSTASVMVGPLVGPSSNRSKAEIPKGGQRRAAARKDR